MESKPTPNPVHDPTKVSRSLAIALVVSAVFLLAASCIATWLLLKGNGGPAANTAQDPDADTKNVKNVSLVAPSMPPEYIKNDQSPLESTRVYYYDNAVNCGFTVNVGPLLADKNAKDTAAAMAETGQQQGVSIASSREGQRVDLKDSSSDRTYSFDTIEIEQAVNVPGIAYTKQNSVVLYKQFGQKVASLAYGCRAEEWSMREDGLAAIAKTFTVTTER